MNTIRVYVVFIQLLTLMKNSYSVVIYFLEPNSYCSIQNLNFISKDDFNFDSKDKRDHAFIKEWILKRSLT